MIEHLTDAQIDARLDLVEKLIARASTKELPALNATFQKLIDEQVRRDLLKTTCQRCHLALLACQCGNLVFGYEDEVPPG